MLKSLEDLLHITRETLEWGQHEIGEVGEISKQGLGNNISNLIITTKWSDLDLTGLYKYNMVPRIR